MVAYSSSRAPHQGGYIGTYRGRQGIQTVLVQEALVRVQDEAWGLALALDWDLVLVQDEGGGLALVQAQAHRASSQGHQVQN
jgi:hypothetical protein